jgi:alcohol dehydrogenase (cytochrome c)
MRTGLLTEAVMSLGGAAMAQTGANWLESGGVPQGTRFSSLAEITPANVGGLVEEFAIPTGSVGAHEGGPLVVGSITYVVTPWPNKPIALDLAHGGQVLWTYAPANSGSGPGHNGRAEPKWWDWWVAHPTK